MSNDGEIFHLEGSVNVGEFRPLFSMFSEVGPSFRVTLRRNSRLESRSWPLPRSESEFSSSA